MTFQHLLAAVKQPAERATAFIAVGRVAVEVSAYLDPADFNPVLTKLIACIHDALTPKKSRGYCPEALTCAAMLSRAVREQLTEYLHDLLAVMFNIGLCKILIHALSEIAENIPALVPLIQERLLRQIAQALGTPVMAIGSRAPAVVATEAEKRKNLCLALQTLGSFNFTVGAGASCLHGRTLVSRRARVEIVVFDCSCVIPSQYCHSTVSVRSACP